MKTMLRHVLTAALLLASSAAALAQGAVLQGGPTTPGHAPMYVGQGSSQAVVQDSGPASGGAVGLGLSELLLAKRGTGAAPYANGGTGPLGTSACMYDGPTNAAAGYHYLCMDPNAQGGGLIAYGAGGAASALPLQFLVNGLPFVFGGQMNITGPLIITPPAGAGQGLVVNQVGLTGTVAGVVSTASGGNPALAYNQIFVSNDEAGVTGGSDPKYTYAQNVAMATGGLTSTGTKIALNAFLYKFSASAPTTPRDHIAMNFGGLIDAGDGGTGTALGQSKGTMFGGGCNVTARAGATNLLEVACMEIDRAMLTGSSATYSFGISLVDSGNIRAAVQDAAIAISGGGGGSGGWGSALLFTDLNGGMPVCTTCTLIKADTSTPMTVSQVMDFSTNVTATYLLRGPSGFYIDGNANIVGASAIFSGAGTNLTLSGNAAPQMLFSASSGSTKQAQFYFQNDVWRIADAGVADRMTLAIATGAPTFLASTAIPAGGTAGSCINFTSTTNFGVCPGSGAPTLAAAKGSLYLRSDGSTTNNRAYINTDGSTTWTPLTTGS